jgi:hypothetical protein
MKTAQVVGPVLREPTEGCICRTLHPRAGDYCNGCRAAEIGQNCWESPASPCCQQDRDACDTCPVFAACMRAQSHTQSVRIILEAGAVVEGDIHLLRGQRLSGALNSIERTYIPITNATVYHPASAGASPDTCEVVLVSKRSVSIVYPVEREQQAHPSATPLPARQTVNAAPMPSPDPQ